jgi:hypothetical protein
MRSGPDRTVNPTAFGPGDARASENAKRLEILYTVKNALVHYWGDEGLVYSVRNKVYQIPDLARPRHEPLGIVPWRGRDLLGYIRPFDRALKASILQVNILSQGGLLVENGRYWWHIPKGGAAEVLPFLSSTRPMSRGICTSPTGEIWIADYRANTERQEPVRIHRSRNLSTFDVAWEFPPGAIRHIHALIPDPEDQRRVWVLTGDEDDESRILYTDDGFRSLQTFLAEGQRTRATDMIIRRGWLIWGMDSPEQTAYILAVPRNGGERTRTLCELPGPAYYMTANQAGAVYMGTTAEPGAAVKDRSGHLFGSLPDGSWGELLRRRKDPFPQHGIFYLPRGILPENFLVYSQRALSPQEGRMVVARDRGWEGETSGQKLRPVWAGKPIEQCCSGNVITSAFSNEKTSGS